MFRTNFVALGIVILLASISTDATDCPSPLRSVYEQNADLTREQIPRIQSHLQLVLGSMRAKDVEELTSFQEKQREHLLSRLEVYAREGVFPRNRSSRTRS